MDENLQRLIQELRAEKCPPRVLESVARRRARSPAPLRRLRTAGAIAAVCIAALAAVMVWRKPNRDAVRPSQAFASNRAQQVWVAEEAVAALGFIGNVLLEAGEHTQNILLNKVVPPLRSGIEATGKTINNKL